MRWRFGGDCEPVLTTCVNDWMECPFALADYIWSEVVTDVAECLANETILWRILALLLICTTVVHLIYWQVRWTKEIQRNNQNLKQVDYKVQDLELKVNILTYKAQYGTWPLPSLSKISAKSDLQATEINRSKFGKANSWIKNLLTRKKNKREINNVHSAGYQTYMDTEISQSEADFSDNLSTDITLLSSSLAPTWKDQIVSSSPSDAEVQSDTRKTLYEVKRRLENLHLSLKNCTLRDWTVMAHTKGRGNNAHGYNDLSSRKRKNHYATIDLRKNIKKNNMSNLIAMYAAYNAMILDKEKPREFVSYPSNDEHSSVANATECSRGENSASKRDDESNISKELSAYKNGVNKSILHSNVTTGTKVMEMHKGDGDSEYFSEKSTSSKNNNKISVVSEKSSIDETSKESDSDDKSTSALLEEALRIKRDLLARIELRKEYELKTQEYNADDKTDEFTYWESIENPFEPKMLDMIFEESSDSSSTDRGSEIKIYNTLEKCTNSQEIKINVNNKGHLGEDKIGVANENFSISKLSEVKTTIADDVNANLLNGENQSLNIANVGNVKENSNPVFLIEVISKDNENQSIETLNLVSELNSSKLTESSSDTSVNRLIDRLIESERRSKSARSSSDSKSKKNLSMDSINNLIDSHKFIEAGQSENEESDNCSQSHSTEKDKSVETNSVDNLACVQSLPSENTEDHKTPRETILEKATEIDEKNTNAIANVDTQNSETECAKPDSNNREQIDANQIYTISAHEKTCVELLMLENDEFSRKQVPIDEIINIKPLIVEINEKNNSSFHCSNDLSTENQLTQENLSTSADDNPTALQLSNCIRSPRGDNLHNPACIVPNTAHYASPLQNAEHSLTKIQKNMNSITLQKQSPKNVTDFKSNRQIRAKSNLNLSYIEKHSLSPMFRRSRSYATPREISFNNKSNAKGEASFDSLTSSSKSSSISHTPREHKDNDEDNELAELEQTKKCPFELTTAADKGISGIKRNDSYKSLSSRSSKSNSMVFPKEPTENYNSKDDIERKNSFESLTSSSKSSSKSCIPILKNRLETTRKNTSESRSSLIQEPLDMSLDSYRAKNEKLIAGLQNSNDHKQKAIVYVNIADENEEITSKVLNPEQFLEYIKNEEIEVKSSRNEEKIHATIMDNNHLMMQSNSKVTSLIPSSSGNIDFTDVSSLDSSSCQLQNDQPQSWPCKVDSKESEVLVKPSTLDISTSITDLPNTYLTVENNENTELKIFEIPEELTKEDYITFLQIVNENPELRQLSNVEESCK